MKRYLKISLLLLLLGPLFLLDVNALEMDKEDVVPHEEILEDISLEQNKEIIIETPPVEEDNSSLGDVLEKIPNCYNLLFTEEEAFMLFDEENDRSQVLIEIENQISSFLNDNNIHLDDYQYSFYVERLLNGNDTNYSIYDYRLVLIPNLEGITYNKTITVTYSNSDDYSIENENIVNGAFNQDEAIEVENSYDFYTDEAINEEQCISDYLDEKLPEVDYNYIFLSDSTEIYEFEQTYNGLTYLFIDEVFYRAFPTIYRVLTKILVSPEITNNDIVNEVREKLEEELQVEIPQNDIVMSDDGGIYKSSNSDYYGVLDVEKIKEEDKKNYSITSGGNSTIVGNGQLKITVDCLMKKFIKLLIDGNEVNKNNYSIQNNDIIISSNYLNTINKGNHELVVRFSDGDSKTNFTLKEENRVEPQIHYETYYPVYVNYSYNTSENNIEVNNKEENRQENNNEKNNKNEKEVKEVLKPEEVVKNNKPSPSPSPKVEKKVEKKEINNSRFNVNYIPIIIVVVAFGFGIFGGYLYKKSLED